MYLQKNGTRSSQEESELSNSDDNDTDQQLNMVSRIY